MAEPEMWYFAYGSNLFTKRMLDRTGATLKARVGILAGYRLAFRRFINGNQTYATIVPMAGEVVYGVAYLCEKEHIQKLDLFEGVAEKCYRRETADIKTETGESICCFVYIGDSLHEGDSSPSTEYLDFILMGAQEHALPLEYIQWIKKIASE